MTLDSKNKVAEIVLLVTATKLYLTYLIWSAYKTLMRFIFPF
jgi:hypothetical protein